ncbi:hypothetical protein METUNv1_01680 [Methyloversatilis universalis FAM5]|uniref:Phage protein n=1 Tax=Methyloversatilis universalis (strain ATCC BAA-1314 / DSM 25237 / JCM 13912 / CCUG 52030 / FAM5) TaxID=1000565 RepID=F5RC39_METUF|nr:hypothetical protein METUNv1_01680 [Methyloversatilis universalis FAM5]
MGELGLTEDDFAGQEFDVWPENWVPLQVLSAMQTQWRCGPAGAIGLDYNVLPEIWRRCKVPPAERDRVFSDLQVMEDAALAELRKPASK